MCTQTTILSFSVTFMSLDKNLVNFYKIHTYKMTPIHHVKHTDYEGNPQFKIKMFIHSLSILYKRTSLSQRTKI